MANKAISELPQAQNVNNQDLFVLEQSGIAKKLTAETFITEQGIIDALAEALDGHGGIQSVTLSSVSGRIRTYLITFTDGSATTFQVLDGTSIDRIVKTSTAGLTDTYTVFMSDGTTTFFTVTNGADGTVSEAMLNDALKDKAPAITETTESSAIANFPDGADDMPVAHLTANIEPVQDLTYGSPYPAGSGKNLLDPTATSGVAKTVWFCEPDGFLFKAGVTYTLSVSDISGVSSVAIYATDKSTQLAYAAGSSLSDGAHYTPESDTYGLPRLYSSSNISQETINGTMLEIGATKTTFAPYSNICPITGWTGCNVTRTGKNLFDKSAITPNSWIVVNTTTIESAPNFYVTDYIPVSVGQPITCTAKGASRSIYYDKNKNPIEYFSWNTGTLNPLHDGYIRTTVQNDYFDSLQIELGSSTTAYEAPQVQTVTVDWTTEAGTVYGGTIDVATGVLTVDRAMVDLGTLNWSRQIASGHERFQNTEMAGIIKGAENNATKANILCTIYATITANGTYNHDEGIGIAVSQASVIFVYDNNYADAAAFKSAMSGVQLVYELAAAQTYQLNPQQIMTLLGTNNVWADTGNVTVTYPADTKMFIEKLTMPTEDDLVANQAITSGQYFMIGNSLYLALANIASGAQITIGTNAQRVSLADALNTINS